MEPQGATRVHPAVFVQNGAVSRVLVLPAHHNANAGNQLLGLGSFHACAGRRTEHKNVARWYTRFSPRGLFRRREEASVAVRDTTEHRAAGIILGVVRFFGEFVALPPPTFLGRLHGRCLPRKGMHIRLSLRIPEDNTNQHILQDLVADVTLTL